MKNVIHYAENSKKTVIENEISYFVTGINCFKESAVEEMIIIKNKFGKTDKNVAFHGYQSFKPKEVTPEIAHKIGVDLAKELWGKSYQVIVTTHLDRDHIHNHFVINSVSFIDGKKFPDKLKSYHDMKNLSDELCENHSLSVIKNPKTNTPRAIYFAEKKGEPTRYNIMREAIDFAISISYTREQFFKVLQKQGYFFDFRESTKHPTIRPKNSKKSTRLYRLGEEYLPIKIYQKIDLNSYNVKIKYLEYMQIKPDKNQFHPKKIKVFGLNKANKITGLKALYFHYCFLLGMFDKNKKRKPLSFEMREECRKLEEYSKEIRLIYSKNLNNSNDVENLINSNQNTLEELTEKRSKIYNKLRRCYDSKQILEFKSERNVLSSKIKELRKETKIAKKILLNTDKIKENITLEMKEKCTLSDTKKIKKDLIR